MGGVVSGSEIACWDIVGKAVEQPIYNLLGGKVHERLSSYPYLYPEDSPAVNAEGELVDTNHPKLDAAGFFGKPDAMPERLQAFMDRGFTAVGLDPVMPMSAYDPRHLSLQDLDLAERVMKALRETAGDQCDLMVKTHGQMTTSSAVRLARRVEPYDPLWLEEPVPPGNIEEMAYVASKTSIPICAGERFIYKNEFATLLEKRAANILNFAVAHVGGLLEAKKIAAMAEAHYAQITPHLYAGPIEAVANIQLSACSTNFLLLESIESFGGFYGALLTKPIQWEDGYVTVPDRPGLGFELNEELCDANPCTFDEVHPPMVADQDLVDQIRKYIESSGGFTILTHSVQEHQPQIGLHRRRGPTDPRVEERHNRSEERRIIQQRIDPRQLPGKPPQLLRQDRLPQRRLITYSTKHDGLESPRN